jgi:hypothetical protein
MALVTRKEFAEMCQTTADAIVTYIRRNKITIVGTDTRCIDPKDPLNVAFLANKLAKKVGKKPEKPKKEALSAEIPDNSDRKKAGRPLKGQEKPKLKPAEIRKKEVELEEKRKISQYRVDQDVQKKGLEIENLELAKQQKMLQLQKAAGELMPVDLVVGVLKRHADSINKSFEKGLESLITVMTHELAAGNALAYGKYLGLAKQTLSDCIKKAGKSADEEVDILVDEFSQTLNRGQRRT